MRHKFFAIPLLDSESAEAELNQFYSQNRIINVEKELVHDARNSLWAVCVTWLPADAELHKHQSADYNKKPKVDYREILSPDDFALFSELRDIRSVVAGKESVAVYRVFNNEQLSIMAQQKITSKSELLKVEGIGQMKVDKYADAFLQKIEQLSINETSND